MRLFEDLLCTKRRKILESFIMVKPAIIWAPFNQTGNWLYTHASTHIHTYQGITKKLYANI